MEDKVPLVSVIIPNYNHAAFLQQRLESVFNQTFRYFEVILLDDASTDASVELLKKYASHPKVSHFIVNQENTGSPFKQWEKGISLSRGEFIWIAEADDFCELDFLEKMILPLNNDPDISLAYCQSTRVNSMNEVTGNWITHTSEFHPNIFVDDFVMKGNEFIEKYLIHKNVIPNVSGVLFRKSKLDLILPLTYKPFLRYNADWYYYIQLLCNSKLAFIANSLNHFRYHNNSVIAKAGNESGWLKIFKMELEGRKEMINYLEQYKPSNLNAIRQQSEIGNLKLKYLTAKGFVDRGEYQESISIVLKERKLLKTILFYFLKKKIHSSRSGYQ